LWPAAALPHLLWMLRQALCLGTHVRPRRFPNSKTEHASVPHIRWLIRVLTDKDHCGYDLSPMRADAPTPDEFLATVRGFLSGAEFKRLYPNRDPLSPDEIDVRIEKMRGRIATHDAPDGCNFGILALNSSEPTDPEFQHLVVRVNGVSNSADCTTEAISWTRTYHRYYAHKAKHAFFMTWDGSLTPPDELKSAFASFEPDVPVIAAPLPRAPKKPKEPKSSSGSTTGKRKSAEAA
jgi:hypothetical protein